MNTPQNVFDGYEAKIAAMAAEIKRLRQQIIDLEGVAEIMDCGHERRFSTLRIGATGNAITCAICENERMRDAGQAVLPYIWDAACLDGETAYQRAMVAFRNALINKGGE